MKVRGLKKKEFVVLIEWIVDAEDLLSEGTEVSLESLETLRGIGTADIVDINLRDKKDVRLLRANLERNPSMPTL